MESDGYLIKSTVLNSWTIRVLEKYGYQEIHAKQIADQLIDSNLREKDSHGIMRLPIYIARVESGLVNPRAKIKSKKRGLSAIIVNGAHAQGQLVAEYMVSKINAKLNKRKNVVISVSSHSTHFGSAGYYAQKIAEQGNIGLVFSNAESCVVPYGGTTAILGTNPIGFAVPSKSTPINIDFATSITTFGDIFIARDNKMTIPQNFGFDEEGNITTNPEDVVSLRPMSEHKGYGLGLMIEILCGIISGAAFGTHIGNMYKDFSKSQNIGHFMLGINIDSIISKDIFLSRIEGLVNMLKSSRQEDDNQPVLIPGEKSQFIKEKRLKEGIELSDVVWKSLLRLSEKSGIKF